MCGFKVMLFDTLAVIMHYFEDRKQAGKLLAEKMKKSRPSYVNPAVLALNEGGAVIGAELAKALHASLYILSTEDVELPGEGDPVGIASSEGNFMYNSMYSSGQMDELRGDYRQVIEQERFRAFQKLNRIVGKDGIIRKELLKRHEIIMVSDGLKDPLKLEVAVDYLKPIAARKLVIATPIATVAVIDKMHLLGDEIFCLGVIDNYLTTHHYYQNNDIPDHKTVVEMMKNIVLSW